MKAQFTTSRSSRDGGFVLATVLVFLVVLSLTAFFAAGLTRTNVQSVNNLQNEKEAFYIAEAGLHEALYRVNLGSPVCVQVSGITGPGGDGCTGGQFDASLSPAPNFGPTPTPSQYYWGLGSNASSTSQILLTNGAPAKSVSGGVTTVTSPTLQPNTTSRLPYSPSGANLTISWDVCTNGTDPGCSAGTGTIRQYTPPPPFNTFSRNVLKIVSTGQSGTAQRTATAWAADFFDVINGPPENGGIQTLGSACTQGIHIQNGVGSIHTDGSILANAGLGNPGACSTAIDGGNNNNIIGCQTQSTTHGCAIASMGQAETAGNAPTYSPAPENAQREIADPLSGLPLPNFGNYATQQPSGCSGNAPSNAVMCTVSNNGGNPLSPGIYYGGLTITGSLTMSPGTYIMAGGGFNMATGSTIVSANGVTIISTNSTNGSGNPPTPGGNYASSTLGNGNAGSGLVAPNDPTNPYDGVLFFQVPANTNLLHLQGGSSGNYTLQGYVYAPTAQVTLQANTNLNIVGSLIANNVDLGGGSNLSVTHTDNVPNGEAPMGGPYTIVAWQDF